MTEPNSSDTESRPSAGPEWTEQQLPPVKPPSASVLVQLFFVPMIIVSIIVGVWLMFGWLAQSGASPEQLAANLQRLNKGSWQDAHSLSNMLRDPRETELRQDKEIAGRLASTLDKLLESEPPLGGDQQKLALWICRALGQFDVDTGLDALIKAMASEDLDVRRAAIEGVGTLAHRVKTDVTSQPDLVRQLEKAGVARASDPRQKAAYDLLRVAAAFSLGIIGGDESRDILSNMLADAHPDVRYNAATGLARLGDDRALPRLKEMIQLDNEDAVRLEEDVNRQWKRQLVIKNGLEALSQLYVANPSLAADSELTSLLEQLDASADIKGELRIRLDKAMAAVN